MNELKIFDNEEFGEIRTVLIDEEPWFVGKDVAEVLGYSNPRDAINKHVDEEDKGVAKCDTLGGKQELTVVNESGLYSLIFSSKMQNAKRFKHWVTSEVLPSIRKTGSYQGASVPAEKIPVGEVAKLTNIMDRVAVRQGLSPHRIAQNFKQICEQFGIRLTDDFVKVPEYEQRYLFSK